VDYAGVEWYTNPNGNELTPGPGVDVTKPVKGLRNMKALCDYAKSKGVDIRVWVDGLHVSAGHGFDSALLL